jgi:hypothetical protein
MATPKQPPRPPTPPRSREHTERVAGMQSPAPAAPAPAALALAPAVDNEALEALRAAGIDIEEDTSGSELVPSDFKTAVKLFNLKSKAPNGQQRRQDRFYDSITNEEQESLEFAILGLHKSNLYGVYDNGEGRTNRVCSSFDQVNGTWAEDGHQRKCEGCPDKRATKQPDGKVRSNCTECDDLFCVELDTSRVFMLRGKRTSRPPIMNYLHQHHFGKGGGRSNIPLYAYRVLATLDMDASGNFANLILERGPLFTPNDLKVLAESAKGIRETLADRMAEAEAQTAAHEGNDGDGGGDAASFNYGAGAEPQKFVNQPA